MATAEAARAPRYAEIFLASWCADLCVKAALHPVDTVKSVVQNTAAAPGGRRAALRGLLLGDAAAAAQQVRNGGAAALYRGLTPTLLGTLPFALVYMPTYELTTTYLKREAPGREWLAGPLTGVVGALVRVPVTGVKTRMQVAEPGGLGLAAAVVRTWRERGPRGFYAGFSATCALDVAYASAQFFAMERLRALGEQLSGGRALQPVENAAVGLLIGAFATVLTEPIDVLKTRMMTGKSTALVVGMGKLVREEGAAALWRGLLPL